MKTKPAFKLQACFETTRPGMCAFSLIELIGVLAVIAILAALLLPFLIKDMDKALSDQEAATMQSFSEAFQRSVLRNHYIPGTNDWAAKVGDETGLPISEVVTNARRSVRYFMIDPNLAIGVNGTGLPYAQSNWTSGSVVTNAGGQIISPASPRVMILSTLGRPFTNMVNGIPATSGDFATIWNTPDGTVPAATVFNNWRGTGDDLKIQRINLAPLFLHLTLNYLASTTNAAFAVDAGTTNAVTAANGVDAFFLQNSVLNLFTRNNNALDSQQILKQDSSFGFYNNAWRGSLPPGSGVPGIGAFDFSTVVNSFLVAPTNSGSGAASQQQVVQAFTNYLGAYNAWAASNFPNGTLKNTAIAAQSNMMTTVDALYKNPVPPQGP